MATVATMGINIIGDVSGLEKALSTAQSRLTSAAQSMRQTGTAMTAGLTLPIIGVGAAAITAANDLNKGLANVASLGVAEERVLELKDSVQSMAVEVGKSTDDLTAGLYQTVSAFGDTADTAAILQINAKAAAGGLATVSDAINLTSAVTKAYNDTSQEAVQHTADLALKTVALGQTTFPELAASIGRVTPFANSLKVSQEELFAVMATATGVTGGAAEVSTQLRGALQALMAPTKATADLMAQLGYENGQAMIEGEGLQGALIKIVQAAEAAGAPLPDYISSIEGVSIAQVLAGSQAENYAQKLEAMRDVVGTTDAAFAAQTEGINANGFAMEQAQIKMLVMTQKLGDGLGPAVLALTELLTPLIDRLIEAANWFARQDPQMQLMIAGLVGVAAAAGPVLIGLSAVASVLALLASPIGLVVVAVAALGAAWATNFGGIRDITESALAPVIDRFNAVVAAFQSGTTSIGGIVTELTGYFTGIGTGADATTGPLGSFVVALTGSEEAARGVEDVLSFLGNTFQQVQERIIAAWTQLEAFLAPAMGRLRETIGTLPESFAPVMPALSRLGEAFGGLRDAVLVVWEALRPVFEAFGSLVAAVFAVVCLAALTLFEAVLSRAGELVATVVDQITASIEFISSTLIDVVALIQAVISGDWDSAWELSGSIVTRTKDFIIDTLERMRSVALTVLEIFTTTVNNVLRDMGVDVDALMNAFATAWRNTWQKISDAVGVIRQAASTFIAEMKDMLSNARSVVDNIRSTVTSAIESMVNSVGSRMRELRETWDNAWSALEGAVEPVKSAVDSLWSALRGFIDWIASLGNPFAGWTLPSIPGFPGNQLGTAYFGGGLTLVGEAGPELVKSAQGLMLVGKEGPEVVNLPRGVQIFSAQETKRIMSSEFIKETMSVAERSAQLPGESVASRALMSMSSVPTVALAIAAAPRYVQPRWLQAAAAAVTPPVLQPSVQSIQTREQALIRTFENVSTTRTSDASSYTVAEAPAERVYTRATPQMPVVPQSQERQVVGVAQGASGTQTLSVVIQQAIIRDERDIHLLAYKVADVLGRRA